MARTDYYFNVFRETSLGSQQLQYISTAQRAKFFLNCFIFKLFSHRMIHTKRSKLNFLPTKWKQQVMNAAYCLIYRQLSNVSSKQLDYSNIHYQRTIPLHHVMFHVKKIDGFIHLVDIPYIWKSLTAIYTVIMPSSCTPMKVENNGYPLTFVQPKIYTSIWCFI